MPNTLDFDVVFNELTRLHETGNIGVLSTIITVLLLYLLVVVFARRADKRDKAKVNWNPSVIIGSYSISLQHACVDLTII